MDSQEGLLNPSRSSSVYGDRLWILEKGCLTHQGLAQCMVIDYGFSRRVAQPIKAVSVW